MQRPCSAIEKQRRSLRRNDHRLCGQAPGRASVHLPLDRRPKASPGTFCQVLAPPKPAPSGALQVRTIGPLGHWAAPCPNNRVLPVYDLSKWVIVGAPFVVEAPRTSDSKFLARWVPRPRASRRGDSSVVRRRAPGTWSRRLGLRRGAGRRGRGFARVSRPQRALPLCRRLPRRAVVGWRRARGAVLLGQGRRRTRGAVGRRGDGALGVPEGWAAGGGEGRHVAVRDGQPLQRSLQGELEPSVRPQRKERGGGEVLGSLERVVTRSVRRTSTASEKTASKESTASFSSIPTALCTAFRDPRPYAIIPSTAEATPSIVLNGHDFNAPRPSNLARTVSELASCRSCRTACLWNVRVRRREDLSSH
jgi:hypothetical protein